jgi:hypothetical protein
MFYAVLLCPSLWRVLVVHSIATGLRYWQWGIRIPRWTTLSFSSSKHLDTRVRVTQPPLQLLPGGFFPVGKEDGEEDINHSPPHTTEVKNEWNFSSDRPCMASWRDQAWICYVAFRNFIIDRYRYKARGVPANIVTKQQMGTSMEAWLGITSYNY